MNVDELVKKLLALRTKHGNMRVESRNEDGHFYDVSAVSKTLSYPSSKSKEWVILIDTP